MLLMVSAKQTLSYFFPDILFFGNVKLRHSEGIRFRKKILNLRHYVGRTLSLILCAG